MAKKIDKVFRLLQMHERLSKGETVIKDTAIAEFNIPPKSFQRDIDSLCLAPNLEKLFEKQHALQAELQAEKFCPQKRHTPG